MKSIGDFKLSFSKLNVSISLSVRIIRNMYLSKGVVVEIKRDGACKVFSLMSDT